MFHLVACSRIEVRRCIENKTVIDVTALCKNLRATKIVLQFREHLHLSLLCFLNILVVRFYY